MLTHFKPEFPIKTELVVALDFENIESAEKIVSTLSGLPIIYKIGLELFTATGSLWVKHLTASGHRVFLDLKLHDIPNTVNKMLDMVYEQLPKDTK